jgi:hypothetical protein
MSDLPSRKEVRNNFIKGVAGIGGGIGLWILGALGFWPGVIVGGLVAGAGALMLRSENEKKAGAVAIGIGAVTAVAASGLPIVSDIRGWLFGLAAIGSTIFGGWSLWKYFQGMKARK